ncbi:hypothetical protein [Ferrimonas aestuarii]|uniref:Uncharacterized protein n=1 Tax=Ferrimonas aestuarii TaxID=2569539 RepID=A0A4U1BTV7_9GAMM|nr:hypothetical protein [Ferrimonas aestuarii]TKB58629.1 hypothetical protein FCL42_02455 [Ferrimonas aestuarii]
MKLFTTLAASAAFAIGLGLSLPSKAIDSCAWRCIDNHMACVESGQFSERYCENEYKACRVSC